MTASVADQALLSGIKGFLLEYLPHVRQRDDDTIVSHRISINLFLEFLRETQGIQISNVKSSDFCQENIVAFMKWLQETRNNAPPTVNHRLCDLRGFCKYFMKKDVLSSIELQEIEEIKQVKDSRKPDFVWLTAEEVKLVIDSVSETRNSIRDRFLLSLLYESGGRIDEVLSLKVGDLVPTPKGEVNVHFFGKGGKHRITPLSKMLWSQAQIYLNKYHPERVSETLLFYVKRKGRKEKMSADNVQRILSYCEQRVREQVPNLPHLHAHLFRRSRAMHLYEHGIALTIISEWLGHAQIETTRFYAQLTGKMKREALNSMQERDKEVFSQEETEFKYAGNEEMLRRLCGLAGD